MGVVPPIPETEAEESAESIQNKMTVLASAGFTDVEKCLEILKKQAFDLDRTMNALLELNGDATIAESELLKNNKLATLTSLGFTNAELNAETLNKHSGDLNRCVSDLLKQDAGSSAQPSSKSDMEASKLKNCPMCTKEFGQSVTKWILVQCGHKLCNECYKLMETTRATMTGLTQTFIKCPICTKTTGVEIGTCPDGTMTTEIVPQPCQGYETYHSIKIKYHIMAPNYELLHRTAYLPNNNEGKELLNRLRIAWERRNCFTIGTSANSRKNVLVWNIHHKTAQSGGATSDGFPDDTYFQRCKAELDALGIK